MKGAPGARTKGTAMKYVILIHSNPQPWGHPTIEHTPEGQAMSKEWHVTSGAAFDALLEELQANGEWVTAQPLAAPASSTIYRWDDGAVATDGPFAEAKEQLAGFFLIDVASAERADEVARQFAAPGDVIELRPVVSGDGTD